MENIDEIFQESKDLELIVSYYEKNGQAEKAAPHIKRIFDQRVKQKEWDKLEVDFRKYRSYLTEAEQRRYVNRIVQTTTDAYHNKLKNIILGEFSELIDSHRFSSFFCSVLDGRVHHDYATSYDVYMMIEKHKGRIDIEKLRPKLAAVLAYFVGRGKVKRADVDRFEPYLDDEAKSSIVIRAMEIAVPYLFELRGKGRDKSKDPGRVLAEFRGYLNRKHAYDIVKGMVERRLGLQIFENDISMHRERSIIELLKKDFMTKEQVTELVNKIASAQFDYSKPGRVQRDPAGDIHEEPEPDYGLPYALDTVKQFPDDIEPELAKKITRKYLARQFFEEANERRSRKTKGTVKETIKACKIDRDTIELALADAFRKEIEFYRARESEILKKFRKYVNRDYVAAIIEEKLPEYPHDILKNYGDYLSDEQLKDAVKGAVKREALRDNFRSLPELIESAEFSQEELSEFFLELFEDVRNNVEVSQFKGKDRGKKDAVLEFLKEFSCYIPRNERTEVYYQLLNLKDQSPD